MLAQSLRACMRGGAAVIIFSLAINLLMLTVPIYMLQIYDRVLSSRSIDTLIALLVMAVSALAVMGALDALRTHVMVRIGLWLDGRLGGPLLGALLSDSTRVTSPTIEPLRDLATVRSFLAGPAINPLLDAPWAPFFLGVMFLLHPTLGWTAVGGAILLFAVAFANERTTRDVWARAGMASQQSNAQAEASLRNSEVIRALGMVPALLRRWRKDNAAALALQGRAGVRVAQFASLSKFLRFSLQVAILSIGALLVIDHAMTAGGMIAGAILMSRALAPVELAISSWRSLVAARDAYGRLKQGAAHLSEEQKFTPMPRPSGQLIVDNLTFGYPGVEQPLLRNIGFALAPGEALGLIGPTASGKTTLARLLVGSLASVMGHVRLDGRDVAAWPSADRGPHLGYLPQDVELFSGTIAENIARMADAEAETVIDAARKAGVHEMIVGLPQGYDTQIGVGGAALSGGQRQRLGLARALFGDPIFVVLDEPNANLDQEGELALIEAIRALKPRNATAVIIAHKPSLLQAVDKVLVLQDGRIAMFGQRDEVFPRLVPRTGGTTATSGPLPRRVTGGNEDKRS